MTAEDRIWDRLDDTDLDLASEIGAKLGMAHVPDECVPGIAMNARLLQRHADNLPGRRS